MMTGEMAKNWIAGAAPCRWVAAGIFLGYYCFPGEARALAPAAVVACSFALAIRPLGSVGARMCGSILLLGMGLILGETSSLLEAARGPPPAPRGFQAAGFRGTLIDDGRRTESGYAVMTVGLEELRFRGEGMRLSVEWPGGPRAITVVSDSGLRPGAGLRIDCRDAVPFSDGIGNAAEAREKGDVGAFFAPESGTAVLGWDRPLSKFRSRLRAGLVRNIEAAAGKAAPLAQALLLGVRDGLPGEEERLFRDAGCAHILSLSGQHLSILCSLVSFAWTRLAGRPAGADVASAVFAFLFLWLAGMNPSLFRAALMCLFSALAKRLDRPQKGLDILSLAFCAAIVLAPSDGRSLSFWLSYAAMAGLILLSSRWADILRGVPPALSAPVASSLAALCATGCISVSAFGKLATGGIVSATLSAPVVTVFMWSSIAAALMGDALPPARAFLAEWHEFLHSILLSIMKAGAAVPAAAATAPAAKAVLCAFIVSLCGFVYASPYIEKAAHDRRKARHDSSAATGAE